MKQPQDIALTDVEADGHIGWVRVNGILDVQICRYKGQTRINAFRTEDGALDLAPAGEMLIFDKDNNDGDAL